MLNFQLQTVNSEEPRYLVQYKKEWTETGSAQDLKRHGRVGSQRSNLRVQSFVGLFRGIHAAKR